MSCHKDVWILTISKKTTEMIQLFDVYGFRVWRNFVRTFSDRDCVIKLWY